MQLSPERYAGSLDTGANHDLGPNRPAVLGRSFDRDWCGFVRDRRPKAHISERPESVLEESLEEDKAAKVRQAQEDAATKRQEDGAARVADEGQEAKAAEWATRAEKKRNCETFVSATITMCKVNCGDQYALLDPGPGRNRLIQQCEDECVKASVDLPRCE